jgi:hypothetical protein
MSILNYILLLSKILGIAFYIAAREMKNMNKSSFLSSSPRDKNFEGKRKNMLRKLCKNVGKKCNQ